MRASKVMPCAVLSARGRSRGLRCKSTAVTRRRFERCGARLSPGPTALSRA